MTAPSKTIAMPTGTTKAMLADLKALEKASKDVTRQMAKDVKKGVEISKELLEQKKKIDKAFAAQKSQIKAVETATYRQAAMEKMEASRDGRPGALQKSIQGVMMLHHLEIEVKRLDASFHAFRAGGPDVDKEQGVLDLLHLGSHIPGPVGIAMRGASMILQAVMAIQASIKNEARGIREIGIALNGGRPYQDPDEVARRESKQIEKKLTYVDPRFGDRPAMAPNALGGGLDPAAFREKLARQIRNENAGIMRTILQGMPLIGGYAQKGGAVWGVDDEAKVNSLIETAINSKIPALIARARERAEIGDLAGAGKDLAEIRKIDSALAPATNPEELLDYSRSQAQWAQRKSIDHMGLRPIEGRAE